MYCRGEECTVGELTVAASTAPSPGHTWDIHLTTQLEPPWTTTTEESVRPGPAGNHLPFFSPSHPQDLKAGSRVPIWGNLSVLLLHHARGLVSLSPTHLLPSLIHGRHGWLLLSLLALGCSPGLPGASDLPRGRAPWLGPLLPTGWSLGEARSMVQDSVISRANLSCRLEVRGIRGSPSWSPCIAMNC